MGRKPVKQWAARILMLAMAVSLTACSSQKPGDAAVMPAQPSLENLAEADSVTGEGLTEETELFTETGDQQESEQDKILIVYFTWADNAADTSGIDATTSASVQPPGNVAQMAAWIQQETGGDLFPIRVEEPYPADYDECLERAADEKAENARPVLSEKVADIEDYGTVFLGYPNWWYSAPMAVFSFLAENDLSGKKVVLFCSHGTGGLASSVKDISAALPDSEIETNVLGVYRDDIPKCQEIISNWLEEIGY